MAPSVPPLACMPSPAAQHSPGLAGGCRDLPRGIDHPAERAGALGLRHAAVVFGDVVQNHPCRRAASWGCGPGTPPPPVGARESPHPRPCPLPGCCPLGGRPCPAAASLPEGEDQPGHSEAEPSLGQVPAERLGPQVLAPSLGWEGRGPALGAFRGSWEGGGLTFWAEAAEGAEAGAAMLRVGAGLHAGVAALPVHLVGRALAHSCRSSGPVRGARGPRPEPPPPARALSARSPGLTAEVGAPPAVDGLAGHAALA